MRKVTIGILFLTMLVGFSFANGQADNAASFPKKPIQVIHPWPAGLGYTIAQSISEGMKDDLGQPVSVTVMDGAGGTKASLTMMSKPADGYTVFDGWVAAMVIAPIFGNVEYTYKDFKPLYGGVSNAFVLVARKDETRYRDLPELISYAQDRPGELVYTAGPKVALPHMAAASTLKQANVVARHVPYGDGNAGMKDLLAGDLDFATANLGTYAKFKDDIIILAVLSDIPQPGFPSEAKLVKDYGLSIGLDGLAATGWSWWVVHKDTPEEVCDILRAAMKKSMDNPEVQKSIEALGYASLSTEDFSPETYEQEMAKMTAQLEAAIDTISWEEKESQKYIK